jgi:hypothetical protein
MTAVHMSAKDFKRLERRIVPGGMNKGEMIHLHLLLVEAALGRRIKPEELRSIRFAESREKFVKLFDEWKGKTK